MNEREKAWEEFQSIVSHIEPAQARYLRMAWEHGYAMGETRGNLRGHAEQRALHPAADIDRAASALLPGDEPTVELPATAQEIA